MSKIYVIHENEAWVEPLRAAFEEQALPYEEWFLSEGVLDLFQPVRLREPGRVQGDDSVSFEGFKRPVEVVAVGHLGPRLFRPPLGGEFTADRFLEPTLIHLVPLAELVLDHQGDFLRLVVPAPHEAPNPVEDVRPRDAVRVLVARLGPARCTHQSPLDLSSRPPTLCSYRSVWRAPAIPHASG